MRLKRSLKTAAQRILGRFGYEVVREEPGRQPFRDVERILGRGVRTVFDVGANVGQTAVEVAARFPAAAIYAFEPDPACFAHLVRATEHLPRVVPLNAALGDLDGERVLHLARHPVGNSLLKVAEGVRIGAWTDPAGEVRVDVQRLDTFCARRGITSIDLLKIDTQGGELMVLNGAGPMFDPGITRAVFCEVNFIRIYEGQPEFVDLYATLTGRGYRLVDLYNPKRGRAGELRWCDALFVAPE